MVQIISSGFPGQPGYTNLALGGADGFSPTVGVDGIAAFVSALGQVFPSTWSAKIDTTIKVFNDATGELVRYESATPAQTTPVSGVMGGSYGAGVAGACIAWSTNGINRGRKIRGRSFMVPLGAAAYQNDGSLDAGVIVALQDAANALIVPSKGLVVWSRPRLKLGGRVGAVVSARIEDKASYLRTRRS